MARIILLAGLAMLLPFEAAAQSLLVARGHWAALRFGKRCEAAARPVPPASTREPQARMGVAFEEGRNATLFVRLSREVRHGSSPIVKIGQRPFLLVGRGGWAWTRGPAQDEAMIAAMRSARSLRVEARDLAGRRFADRYLLAGAPTAIDAAAAACAGKN